MVAPRNEAQRRPAARARLSSIQLGLPLATLSAGTILVLRSLPEWLVSWDGVQIGVVALALFILLLFAWSASHGNPNEASFNSALVLWTFLLISGELFSRNGGDTESALQGRFSVAVYGEVVLWVVILLVLLVVSLTSPRYLRYMFSGQYKWLSAFGLLCLLSTLRSPRPLFSATWAFKLCLVIGVLGLCSSLIRHEDRLATFLRTTFWGCSFLIVAEACRAFADPSAAFEGGRFGQSPTGLSVVAGIVLVLSLTLHSLKLPIWPVVFGILASAAMILAGGKAGIIGGIVSAGLYFLAKKKLGAAFALLAGMIVLGALLLHVSTGLRSYFNTYAETDQLYTATGRTYLWAAAMPLIRESPLLGHGYMASKFVAVQAVGVGWEASQMHNAFLDVLYNNGLIGLILILFMQAVTVRNLLHVIRHPGSGFECCQIAVGLLAVYSNLLINEFFNAIIGGRPDTFFMVFLAIFACSETLARGLTHRLLGARN